MAALLPSHMWQCKPHRHASDLGPVVQAAAAITSLVSALHSAYSSFTSMKGSRHASTWGAPPATPPAQHLMLSFCRTPPESCIHGLYSGACAYVRQKLNYGNYGTSDHITVVACTSMRGSRTRRGGLHVSPHGGPSPCSAFVTAQRTASLINMKNEVGCTQTWQARMQ